jgi:hypothetical protein
MTVVTTVIVAVDAQTDDRWSGSFIAAKLFVLLVLLLGAVAGTYALASRARRLSRG